MAFTYTYIDGQRVETAVARAFGAMAAEFQRVFGLTLHVRSGTRTRAEQQVLYNTYLKYGKPLAAKPGSSNHEEFGPTGPRALDLYDSGQDDGVTVAGSTRAKWLRANASRWGFDPAGYTFSQVEPWHYEYTGALDNGAISPDGKLNVDGEWGAATTSKLQSVLGVPVDGQMGPVTISALQRGLGVAVDGQMGPQTISALQAKVGATVDGQLGPNTVKALQIWLNNGQGFTPDNGQLQVDGQWGPATTRKFQHSVGAPEDGELGPVTWKAFQAAVGVTVDGEPGPNTYKAMQKNVGAAVDGLLGPDTIRKLQEFLNAGKTWQKFDLPVEPPRPVAVARAPRYPKAKTGWAVPLGWRLVDDEWIPNTRKVGIVVNRLIVHHETALRSQVEYFKTANSRSSAPTWEVERDGSVNEMIDPVLKPSSTSTANEYSVAIETTNTSGDPVWGISEQSHEAIAQIAAWLSTLTEIDGVPVDIKLDRTHIIGHNEAGVNATVCPGPSMNLDKIVARAQEIANVDPEPEPEPEVPTLNELIKKGYAELGELINKLEA